MRRRERRLEGVQRDVCGVSVCVCVPAMDVPVCDVMRLGQNVLVT